MPALGDIRVLSARAPHPGGIEVARDAQPVQGEFAAAISRLVILIHGYNNTAEVAQNSFGDFLAHCGPRIAGAAGEPCCFHWPGNRPWSLLSFASYPTEIRPAINSAERLYRFMGGLLRPGGLPLEVTLICHSLGNRVALELLDLARQDPSSTRPLIRALCMMAPAVRVSAVESGGNLSAAVDAADRTLALHSADDWVLHYGFPLGQTLAGEGFFPTAVGRRGEPAARWTQRGDMGQSGYGHSNYWGGQESADKVTAFLGVAVATETDSRSTPTRETPIAPGLADRATPDREIG